MRAKAAALRIQDSLVAPLHVGSSEVYVAASTGISLFPNDADDMGTLLRNAEPPMYEAKRNGRPGSVRAPRSARAPSARPASVTGRRRAVERQRWVRPYSRVADLDRGR